MIKLHFLPIKKFKTFTVSVNIHRPLNKEDATKNALLANVLRRGCNAYPTSQEIAQYLENLYGTVMSCGINKKGEAQILYFNFEAVDDQYIPEEANLLEEILGFAKSIIFDPVVEDRGFKATYVEQEKLKLKDMIESLINNKTSYAVERCYQEMCKDEPFGVYELGNIQDIDSINEKNLYQYYSQNILSSPIDIFVAGAMDKKNVFDIVSTLFDIDFEQQLTYPTTEIVTEVMNQKNIEEALEVNQGKLSLGFRTKIAPKDEAYYALLVCNGILGGGPHAKLFNNVREKMSLAYYVFSRLEKFKGLMIISSGIEIQNYQKALDEILAQVKAVKKGEISDIEYEATINSLVNGIESLKDNAMHIIDFNLSQLVSGTDYTLDDIIQKVMAVKKEDVIKVAQNIELDTIYFLKNKA